jgi:hypothetical protein
MSAAANLRLVDNPLGEKERLADEQNVLVGSGRAIAVAKFRELADKLESGELDGARVQWRRQSTAEMDAGNPSQMQTVTVTADADYRVGTVQLLTFTIDESFEEPKGG